MKKIALMALLSCALFTVSQAEAIGFFGISFGGGFVERRAPAPVIVEEYYYDAPCCHYGCHAPVGYRRVYTRPAYYERVYVQPRPVFSIGFGR